MDVKNTGVLFGSKHTARDYGLMLTSRPDTGSPKPKTYSQDIPGADGMLDLTEATTGEVKYSNRTVTIKAKRIMPMEEQELFKSELLGDLHGRKMQVVLDEDPERYYYGRVTVTFPERSKNQLYVTFTVDAQPYKLAVNETVVEVTLANVSQVQDIALPIQDSSQFAWNANFVLPAGDPLCDFSGYSGIAVRYRGNDRTSGARNFQVTSGEGSNAHTYTRSITAADIAARRLYVSTADLTAAGVDITDIRRVLCSGYGSDLIDLCGVALWGFIHLINGQMSVVPEIYCPAGSSVTLNYLGKSYELEEGWNMYDDLLLPAGISTINVVSGFDTTLAIRYRMGWL